MKCAFLAAVTIVVANAASAWSQEPKSIVAPSVGESSGLASGAAEDQLAPVRENWTETPRPADDSTTYGGGSSYYGNGRFWVTAEALLWWIQPGNTPPLVTSGTVASAGALGPGTTTLFGGSQGSNMLPGGRFTAGGWLDCDRTLGVEGSFLFLTGPSNNFNASGSGAPGSAVVARPFINAITGLQDSQLVSFPGIASGSVGVSSSGPQFLGAQLNGLCNLCCCCNSCCTTGCCPPCGQTDCCYPSGYNVNLISGVSYFRLNENLVITENITILPTAPSPPFTPGQTIMVTDRFETTNNFYGGQIGLRGEYFRDRWFVNGTGILALGDTHQEVRISGSTVFTNPGGAPVTQQGGLLALPTNIGNYSRDVFTVIPQININVGRQVTDRLRIFVGYNFMYWSNVVRPGDQIDPVINPTQLPTSTGPGTLVGPARPAFAFHDTGVWLQGVSLGLGYSW